MLKAKTLTQIVQRTLLKKKNRMRDYSEYIFLKILLLKIKIRLDCSSVRESLPEALD
jgi:hypothetical protein